MRLPKGVLVAIPVYAVQRNPEIFPDPDAFQPERFLKRPELASSPAFQAFGAGPRNCIGKTRSSFPISYHAVFHL